ncbi:MAG: hypothetical protein IIA07_07780 [Proteobacteria bacterium]|nr:hypothetical protein [Pseudomonadota bacterium]
MKTTHVVALELFLVLLLAGCASLPMDQACRAGIDKESKVLAANGHRMRLHRSPDFEFLLSAAEDSELVGDYEDCLTLLQMARVDRHPWTQIDYYGHSAQNTNSQPGYRQPISGQSKDVAHHAAGHTHHHGHD